MDKRSFKNSAQFFDDEDVISENDNFVSSFFVKVHKVFTRHQFVRICDVDRLLLDTTVRLLMLQKVLNCHFTLHF